jgi:hypothetical protein
MATLRVPIWKIEQTEKKQDARFKMVFEAIRELMRPPKPPSGLSIWK